MSTVSVTNINDGDSVTAASVNNQINTIVNDYNGNITDANVSASAAIGANKLAGGTTGMFGATASYTPTWTNLTIGNGTNASTYIQIGKIVFVFLSFTLGSTSSVSSNASFTLPVTAKTLAAESILGVVASIHSGAGYSSAVTWKTTTSAFVRPLGASGNGTINQGTSSTVPFTWATGDSINGYFMYEAA